MGEMFVDGRILKYLRQKRGLRLNDLAEYTGVSLQYLCHVETGRRTASANVSAKLVEALQPSMQEIGAVQYFLAL